jgi:hypothetical protein
MATVHIQATAVCAGGEHVKVSASVDGGPVKVFDYLGAELRDTLDGDLGVKNRDAVLALIEIHNIGKTPAQAKADLQAGLNLVI